MANKEWLSYSEQVKLLRQRGLSIIDENECADFLSRVNYYRLSGYFRYWQQDPSYGDNHFVDGASFETIRDLYLAEQTLKATCIPLLNSLEVLIRTRFAHCYAEIVGPTQSFARGLGLTQPPAHPDGTLSERVEERALSNLDRSKEPFVAHYRDAVNQKPPYAAKAYDRMPIWVAVEAFSFGTLSKMLEASRDSGVLDRVAASMSVSRKNLPSQVRSFVYLRNRIAHCAKLWNHAVLDKPSLQPAQVRRAKRTRNFDDVSVYKVLLAMDAMAKKTGIAQNWLEESLEPILHSSQLLEAGIATPRKYGEMPVHLLLR